MSVEAQDGSTSRQVLYREFGQLCAIEKLRPGEAVEALMRLALESRTVAGVRLDQVEQENTVRLLDDALFRSRLDRLKKSLELEEQYPKGERRTRIGR